jgi:hypothetical protein
MLHAEILRGVLHPPPPHPLTPVRRTHHHTGSPIVVSHPDRVRPSPHSIFAPRLLHRARTRTSNTPRVAFRDFEQATRAGYA